MLQRIKWDVDFIGVLATNEEVYEQTGRNKAVFINKQNYLQFFVKVISETPYSFPTNQKLFTCYSSEIEKYGFEENYHALEFDRTEDLKQFLMDSIIMFKPFKKTLSSREEIYVANEIRLIPKMNSFKEDQQFKAIPLFSEKMNKISSDDFKINLLNGKYVGKIDNISTEKDDTPTIVLWKDSSHEYTVYGPFESHEYAHGGFSFRSNNGVKKDSFENWIHKAYSEENIDDTVVFVDVDTYRDIEKKLEALPLLMEDFNEISDSFIPSNSNQSEAPQVKDKINSVEDDTLRKEEEFMEHFIQVTKDIGLMYNEKDLYNFHTAVKSGSLTILAGMSGTGKSRLVQAYGKALGLDQSQLLFIPVRPSWTDDSDLLGYVDTKNMLYRPGDSSLVDTLLQADADRNKLYVICFDEMNLARVEHYFSQFLSVLEMEVNRRFLRLYSERISQQIYNSVQYSPELNIGTNVIFIGTVNMDESTYHFSDKVLDRANVISLDVQRYTKLKEMNIKEDKDKDNKNRKPYTHEQYNKFKNINNNILLNDMNLDFLWEMHNIMQKQNKNLGIGPRIIKQIDLYIKNIPENTCLSKEHAFDLQIVQRILTKLRGPEGLLKDLIGAMTDNGLDGSLFSLLERNKDLSDFEESKKVLIQKAKELKINGFTI